MKEKAPNISPSWVLAGVLVVGMLASFTAGATQTFASKPLLKVEVQGHTGVITGISVTPDDRFVWTGGLDGTLRQWSLADGQLLRTLHFPKFVSDGQPERLSGLPIAQSLSQNGKTLAILAANSAADRIGLPTNVLFVLDLPLGTVRKRIVVTDDSFDVAFSSDSKAILLSHEAGVDFFSAADGRKFASVAPKNVCGTRRSKLEPLFALGGNLIPGHLFDTDSDGELFLGVGHCLQRFVAFGSGKTPVRDTIRLAKEQQLLDGQILAMVLSPDGCSLATASLSSDGQQTVEVRSTADLSVVHRLYAGDARFRSLEWSSTGATLYGAGLLADKTQFLVREWLDLGTGRFRDIGTDTTEQIEVLRARPTGGVVFGSGNGSWGAVTGKGQLLLTRQTQTVAFYGGSAGFKVNEKGTAVQFGKYWGHDPLFFSVDDRQLATDLRSTEKFFPPIISHAASGLQLEDWEGEVEPRLNDVIIDTAGAGALSASIDAQGKYVILGVTDGLLKINAAQFLKTPGESWQWLEEEIDGLSPGAVNITRDGRLIVAGLLDGTIRWYRFDNGQEVLALYPHLDGKRWVLWTPSGYYDASPGGENLIGWHVENGPDQLADFFPASRFRSHYYRPDVVSRVLETLDEGAALNAARADALADGSGLIAQSVPAPQPVTKYLPPVVTVLSPQTGGTFSSDTVNMRVSIRNPSGVPLTGLQVRVNGVRVARERGGELVLGNSSGQAASAIERTFTFAVPTEDIQIAVIVTNRNAASEPATVLLRWAGEIAEATAELTLMPKLYALVLGVSDYVNPDLNLRFAAKDARDFGAAIEEQKGRLYGDVTVRLLTDADVTQDNVLDALDWLEKETTAKDVAMVFLAGHGVNDRNGEYYFLPADVELDSLRRTGLPYSEIERTMQNLAGKRFLFVDTCHAGGIMGGRRGVPDINGLINELTDAENGAVVLASSTGRQYSLEREDWGNGAFTKALVEGLRGDVQVDEMRLMFREKVTWKLLSYYVSERVKQLTNGEQSPSSPPTDDVMTDFPIAAIVPGDE